MAAEISPNEVELPKGEQQEIQENSSQAKHEIGENTRKLSEIQVNPNLGNMIEGAEPVFSSPEKIISDTESVMPEQILATSNIDEEKKKEIINHLLDVEVSSDNAFDVMNSAENFGQIE